MNALTLTFKKYDWLDMNIASYPVTHIFEDLCDEMIDEIVNYILIRSPRRKNYHAYFTGTGRLTEEKEMISNIFSVFETARLYCPDFRDTLNLFIYIDNRFNDVWLNMLNYASYRGYRKRYFRTIFFASEKGWLEWMDPMSVVRGELEDELHAACQRAGVIDIGTLEEMSNWISP